MAATARFELYNGLVRKIGYSVGLEYLTERVHDLVELYVSHGNVDGADWNHLIESWGRRSSAGQHIADVYAQLALIRRQNNFIQVLPALEVLGMLFTESEEPGVSPDQDTQASALSFILAQKVLEADGDIFLNALSADFDPAGLSQKLQELIQHKRTKVKPLFRQAAVIRRVMESISIRNQTEAAGKPKRLSYAEQSRLLGTMGGPQSPTAIEWSDQEIFISDDYLEKICLTRRNWAEELGLYDKATRRKSELGSELLRAAAQIGLAFEASSGTSYSFWPYGYELRRMGIPPDEIGVADNSAWRLLAMLVDLFVPRRASSRSTSAKADREHILSDLSRAQHLYRTVSRRGVIRHDLPLFIAEPALAFWMKRRGQELPDLREFLRSEFARKDRRVDFVMIRGTEGGLRLMVERGRNGYEG